MEQFMCNPGLAHLGCQIFKCLGTEDLKQCRLVCRSWLYFIDSDQKFAWNKILQEILSRDNALKWFSKPTTNQAWRDLADTIRGSSGSLEDKKLLSITFGRFKPQNYPTPLHQLATASKTYEGSTKCAIFILENIDYDIGAALDDIGIKIL